MVRIIEDRCRFLLAFLMFVCFFAGTLITTNALFALDGMVNHTYVESEVVEAKGGLHSSCVEEKNSSSISHNAVVDGPFPWDATIEALINSMILFGYIAGNLIALIAYDFLSGRVLYAVALSFAGLINLLTPFLTWNGGFPSLVVLRFFTGMYTSIATPAITTFITDLFTPGEQYLMHSMIWLGVESGRIFFSLSGYIIEHVGWECLFYFPGLLALFSGIAFFIFMTDDPLDNTFLSAKERQIIATKQKRIFRPPEVDISIVIYEEKNKKSAPWTKILLTPMFWIATLQCFSQSWGSPVTVMGMKKYLLEIHGYTVKEASKMVTLPTNIATICFSILSAFLARKAHRSNKIKAIDIRRISAITCSLSALPVLLLTFLPCSFFVNQTGITFFQSWIAIRVTGNFAGYATLRDISKVYNRQVYIISSLIYSTLPGIIVANMMAWFGTSSENSWRSIFILSSLCMVAGNWIYVTFVNKDVHADWDPHYKKKKEAEEKNA